MAEQRSLDRAVVSLLGEIESLLIRNERATAVDEYRRGYREALTELKNGVHVIDLHDALVALGWQAPRRWWVAPAAPSVTAAGEEGERDG